MVKLKFEQDCSYQGEALKVPTAYKRLWGSNNKNSIKKLNEIKYYEKRVF